MSRYEQLFSRKRKEGIAKQSDECGMTRAWQRAHGEERTEPLCAANRETQRNSPFRLAQRHEEKQKAAQTPGRCLASRG